MADYGAGVWAAVTLADNNATRNLARSILSNETQATRPSLQKLAQAYLDLLEVSEDYFRQSLPYHGDAKAERASERLRDLLPKVGES